MLAWERSESTGQTAGPWGEMHWSLPPAWGGTVSVGCVSLCSEPSAWPRTGQPELHSGTVIPTKTRHPSLTHVILSSQHGVPCLCFLLSLTTHLMAQVTRPFHRPANRAGDTTLLGSQAAPLPAGVCSSKPGCSPRWWLAPDSRGIGSGFFGSWRGQDATP